MDDRPDGDPSRTARTAAVKATYERIATHFAATREYAWPEVKSFVADCPPGRVGLDLGCGNCRHAELLATRTDRVVGLDLSRGLLATGRTRARERGFDDQLDLLEGDAATLPLASDTIDLAVYVATLHHLPTRETRIASLAALERVLAPGGRALVSAWSTAHPTFDGHDEGFDTTVDWTLPGGDPVARFYHIYDPDEFDADLEQSGLSVRECTVSSGNCYAVVESR
ncbi:class I SAM-dependent methyltransferase [Natronobiforma cellulositropha]|uniref:class I SAM-dependent methyltransferase n=1 Tax=Natronobiforma cellulositropha TaxID=1679076 RepID=UPI0021D5700A|nr:class I SAM-dependent methyltransferase [Natronobiforma cellulositropha]